MISDMYHTRITHYVWDHICTTLNVACLLHCTGVTVGTELPTNLNITEGTDPTVEYCVVISVPDMNATIQRSDFSVCVSTVDGTAMGENIDYITRPKYFLAPQIKTIHS